MDIEGTLKNQTKIASVIKTSYLQDRLSHAYLFYGEEGVGKKEMAYYIACLLYCKDDCSFTCDDCKRILANEHMNVHYIGVNDNKTLISKGQIEELQAEFSKTSLIEGDRVYIVDGIDSASNAAQNSLLKFIEEPDNSEPTYGIFIAKNLTDVALTIQSRCSIIFFPPLERKIIIDKLIDLNVPAKESHLISHITNNIDDAKAYYDDAENKRMFEIFDLFMKVKNGAEAVIFLKENSTYLSNVKKLEIFIKWLTAIYEQLILLYTKEKSEFNFYEKELGKWMQRYSYDAIKKNLGIILDLESRIGYNVIPKNILHQVVANLF